MKISIIFIFFICFFLFFGCSKESPTTPDIDINEPTELSNATKNIEKAMQNSDVATFQSLIHPRTLSFYKGLSESNKDKLPSFSEIFKTRKIISITKDYATYEVLLNGKYYEITMTLDDDGKWKLTDF